MFLARCIIITKKGNQCKFERKIGFICKTHANHSKTANNSTEYITRCSVITKNGNECCRKIKKSYQQDKGSISTKMCGIHKYHTIRNEKDKCKWFIDGFCLNKKINENYCLEHTPEVEIIDNSEYLLKIKELELKLAELTEIINDLNIKLINEQNKSSNLNRIIMNKIESRRNEEEQIDIKDEDKQWKKNWDKEQIQIKDEIDKQKIINEKRINKMKSKAQLRK